MKRTYNMSIIKPGLVFAGKHSPNIHNEIIRVYKEYGTYGRTLCEVEQYGATLETQHFGTDIRFYANSDIISALNKGNAHIILSR